MIYYGIAALIAVAVLIAWVVTRPDEFHVERSAEINAPADVVYTIINDLHQWVRWSPYNDRDPEMKIEYDGPPAGPGAIYLWNGNGQVGEGRMTIVDSRPNERVSMKLEFTRPFQCTNSVQFTLAPGAGGTRVSWIMDGRNTLFSKVMSLVMTMDKMCGRDFEQGLANLDRIAREDVRISKTPAPSV